MTGSGAAASVALLGPSLFDLGCAPSTYIRRDIGGLDASSPIVQFKLLQRDVYYEVYVGLPKEATPEFQSPQYVGNIALFGHGLRDEHQHGGFRPASFSFKINRAVEAALKKTPQADSLRVLFVPRSSAREGKPTEARPSATIRIGSASVSVLRMKE